MLAGIKSIREMEIREKRVFCRLDLNVPMQDGKVTDDTRIRAALPTINYALARNCKVILCSHLGRPKGEVKKEFSLEPVARKLAELLDHEVVLSDFPCGLATQKLVRELSKGQILLLENVRYSSDETMNTESFAEELGSYADIYINDAFGTAHREHASTAGMVPFVQGACGVGFVMEKELQALNTLLNEPKKPFVTVLGGSKVSDKMGLILSLTDKCDTLLIGGAMAYTFLHVLGQDVGNSLVEQDHLETAIKILATIENKGVKLLLPVDHVVATEISDSATSRIISSGFHTGEMGLDIGPETQKRYIEEIEKAGKVFWNGPMGVFEVDQFSAGSKAVAKAMANTSAYTVVGGGDSVAAMASIRRNDEVDHISTGGGASLTFLEEKPLPALEAIKLSHKLKKG